MIELRRQHPVLVEGELVWLANSGEDHVLTYLRRTAQEELLIAVNLSNVPFRGMVEVESGDWRQISFPHTPSEETAIPALALDAYAFRIFSNRAH